MSKFHHKARFSQHSPPLTKNNFKGADRMDLLSRDVLMYIARFLETVSLTRLSIVNRRLRTLLGRHEKLVRWREALRKPGVHLLEFVYAENDIELARYCFEGYEIHYADEGLYRASYYGHVRLVEFYISCGATNSWRGLTEACGAGHIDLVLFFLNKGTLPFGVDFRAALAGRHINVVKLLLEHCDHLSRLYINAVRLHAAELLVSDGANAFETSAQSCAHE